MFVYVSVYACVYVYDIYDAYDIYGAYDACVMCMCVHVHVCDFFLPLPLSKLQVSTPGSLNLALFLISPTVPCAVFFFFSRQTGLPPGILLYPLSSFHFHCCDKTP